MARFKERRDELKEKGKEFKDISIEKTKEKKAQVKELKDKGNHEL